MILFPAGEDSSLGVTDGTIGDDFLTESSCYQDTYCATYARLNDDDNSHCWIPATNGTNGTEEYIQIEASDSFTLKSVGTKGKPNDHNYVTKYKIAYSVGGENWTMYEQDGEVVVRMDTF